MISLKKVVSETLEDFISKMKSKDKKARTIEMEYKSLAQNGKKMFILALTEKHQLLDLLSVLNDKTKKIKRHVKEAKLYGRETSSVGDSSSRSASVSSQRSYT